MTRSDVYLLILLLLSVLSVSFFLFEVYFPLGLLYGPFLFGFIKNTSYKNFLPHCLPFVLYQIVGQGTYLMSINPQPLYYFAAGFSFLIYGIMGLLVSRSEQDFSKHRLVSQLSFLFIFCSLFIGLRGLDAMPFAEVGFGAEYLILGIYVFSGLLCYLHLHRSLTWTISSGDEVPVEPLGSMPVPEFPEDYIERLKQEDLKEEIYLNSNLTLEKLALELDIPKHQLSKALKVHFDTNFYGYIGAYRIKYAVKQIESGNCLTLESLAYECGFNSKTSFNKYFKEHTGVQPSEYRNRSGKKEAAI